MQQTLNILLEAEQLEGTQATISNWLVKVGDHVTPDQPIVELETDKVAIEITAANNGIIDTIDKLVGSSVAVNDLLATLRLGAERPTSDSVINTRQTSDPSIDLPSLDTPSKRHLMGPAVKKLINQHCLEASTLAGTGLGGRITKKDVLNSLNQNGTNQYSSTDAISNLSANQDQEQNSQLLQDSYHTPHSSMRKSIANHMVKSLLQTSPHVTSVFEMDMSAIINHRALRKLGYLDAGAKLTFTAYFLAASAQAIAEVPQINSQFHDESLETFNTINIGVGTALGDSGLVVPVVRDISHKSLFEIASQLSEQTQRARERRLTADDMRGGTFTLSNYGTGGSLLATPIVINQPQVAILGIGKMEKRVVVESISGDDKMVIKPMCYVSLTIDHRAIDAHQTNKFLKKFVEVIEQWN